MRNPFKRTPEPPALRRRVELLEIRSNDLEDSIEKVLYQQTRMMGKVNARHKKQLDAAEAALEAPEVPAGPALTDPNGYLTTAPQGDLKTYLRQQAALLRRR